MQEDSYQKAGRYFLPGFIMILLVIVLDQYTKWLVTEIMLREENVINSFRQWFFTEHMVSRFFDQQEKFRTVEIAPYINFTMVWNFGISFGLLNKGGDIVRLALIAFSLSVSGGMIIWLALTNNKMVTAALEMIAGGAIGNVIDRIRFGAVADFVDVYVGAWHWPAFNLADSCIVGGAFLLALDALISSKKEISKHEVINDNDE